MRTLSDIGQELPDMMTGYRVDIIRPAIILAYQRKPLSLSA